MSHGNRKSNPYLYNIRILRTYLEYIQKFYPDVDIDRILLWAGISRSELADDGYWCTQEQTDRFQEMVDRLTGNPNIAREAGSYGSISASFSTIRQYFLGFIEPSTAYALLGKIGSKLTRGTRITINRIASNKVEAIFELNPGVHEKPYQCQNRMGMMEAMAMSFTGEYASVQHSECIHQGSIRCRYIISWNEPHSLKLKRWRNRFLLLSAGIEILLSLFLSITSLAVIGLTLTSTIIGFSNYIGLKEKQDLRKHIDYQGRIAEELLAESNRRYRDAELIQELGQAITNFFDIDEMLNTAMLSLKKHLDYERGFVLLANSEKTRLQIKADYGYTSEQQNFLRKVELHLDNAASKGPFVKAFKEKTPFLVKDVNEIIDDLSSRSRELVINSNARSFICVPIVYEDESLGVLSLDNTKSMGPPQQSDLNLLMGIAPQMAICINNARTFEKMQASEEKYRVLVESANSIIFRLDTQGRVTFANSFAQKFYGYAHAEMIGKNVARFILPEKDSQGRDIVIQMERFLKDPERYVTLETESLCKNGQSVWVSWSNKAIRDKDGDIVEVLCVGNDITARKQAEEEKKQLEEQLVRAQKMEAIGALAGGVAHDLNNILSGLTSYPELLLMELKEDNPLRKAVLTIKKSGDKAAAIVQDLLTLARRGVSVSNVIDLNAIISDYLECPEFKKLVDYHPHVEFVTHLEQELKLILGSEVHLAKTVMNLVSNAAEAMPKGGKVIIGTEHRYLSLPLRGYDTVATGEYVVLIVEDNGIGIPQEDIKRIFEPFFSKKIMGRSGTGLGMTVVWSTVKDHHGYIDVESVEGKGTKFYLYFPVTCKTAIKDSARDTIEKYSGTESVLIVDDSEDQRELTRNVLTRLGYRVDVAKSGEEALKIIQDHPVELMVVDMIMDPGIDGLDTYRRALDICAKQKAIILSGFSESDRVRQALDLGVGLYIRKPYTLKDLARAVRAELDKK